MVTAVGDALSGGEAFVAVEHSGDANVQVLKLTTNDASLPEDTSGAFQAVGNFVEDDLDVTYTVDCPEDSAGAVCSVVANENARDCGLAYSEGADENYTNLKEACGDATYAVGMKFVKQDNLVPHFVLLATLDTESNDKECPSMIMFEGTRNGKKEMYSTKYPIAGSDTEDIHSFGKVTLSVLLDTESKVDAIPRDELQILTNNCVFYAGRMLRDLGFGYNNALAEFILDYIVDSEELRGILQMEMGNDGRTRRLFEDSQSFKAYLTESVHAILEHEWK